MNRNETFNAMDIHTLAARTVWATLEVVVDDVDNLQVLVAGDDDHVEDLKAAVEDGKLVVEQPARSFTPKLTTVRWMQVTIRVPKDWKGAVEAETVSGPLKARGLDGSDLALETISGDIRATSLRGISVKMGTVTGQISASGVRTAKLNLRTISGGVRLEASQAKEVRLNSVSGAIHLELTEPFERIEGNAVSGDVRISVPMRKAHVGFRSVTGPLRTSGVSIVDEAPPVSITSVSGGLYLSTSLEEPAD